MTNYRESPFGPLAAVSWPSAYSAFVSTFGSTTPLAPGIGPLDVAAAGDNAGHVAWKVVVQVTDPPSPRKKIASGDPSGASSDWTLVPVVAVGTIVYYDVSGSAIDPCDQAGVVAYRFSEETGSQRMELFGLHPFTACFSTGGSPPALTAWDDFDAVTLS